MSDEYTFDLGTYSHPVTTESPDAQAWFDRGLMWSYGFNFEEAERCFTRAAKADDRCVMAYWGIAYAAGPNYNKAWRLFDPLDFAVSTRRAQAALHRAQELAESANATERALVAALAARYPEDPNSATPAELAPHLNIAYAEAMRGVFEVFGDDLDVATLFADALMCVSPRQLWSVDTGEAIGYGTRDAEQALVRAIASPEGKKHAGVNHLYIHLMEMSPRPEAARASAQLLRRIAPGAGHFAHMSSHIDNACGEYQRSVDSNTDALAADDRYFQHNPDALFHRLSRAHNTYVKIFAAMMMGNYTDALSTAERLIEYLPAEALRVKSPPMADWMESHVSAIAHVFIRFGRWEEILELELPEDRELFCVTTAMYLYAKGVAYASLGRVEEAEQAREEFAAAAALVPPSRLSLPNSEVEVLKVAAAMLEGEVEYRKGNYDVAFASLRRAIELEDALQYADPRSWLQPVRHAYGALLTEQGRIEEAAAVYRSDLGLDGRLPRVRVHLNNVWSLQGLHECLTRLGRHDEAAMIAAQKDIAIASADVPITASCFCRLSAVGGPEESCSDDSCHTTEPSAHSMHQGERAGCACSSSGSPCDCGSHGTGGMTRAPAHGAR